MIEYKGGQFFYSFAVNGKSAVTVSTVDLRVTEAMVKCIYSGKPKIDFAALTAQAMRERQLTKIWTGGKVATTWVGRSDQDPNTRSVRIMRNGEYQWVRLLDLTGEEIDTILERWIHP